MRILKKVFLAVILGIILFLAIFFMKSVKRPHPLEQTSYALGTILHFQIWGKDANQALEKALSRIHDIEVHMSTHDPNSDIYKVNVSSGSSFVPVHEDTFYVVEKAIDYAYKSSGTFEPTIGGLVNLWGIGTPEERLPSQEEIANAVSLIGYEEVQLDRKNMSIRLPRSGQHLDLGGIAKGYAADEVVAILKRKGIKSALVDLGGNIFALGTKPDSTLWNIGVQNPLEPRGQYLGVLRVSNKSVVTSGNYERFFEKDGKRYHHIFDPATGYPAESGLLSVTILSDRSIDGDALSTALFVLGKEEGLKLASSIEGVEALVVTKEKKIYGTAGMDDFFKLTNKEYTYEKGK
ncbi:FAD:protein FMN transferase [Aminobacterium colombiense]|uniref:FAD:protein FMN transferase n=1 Tax=Aminobacterium colombiense TaxID=81468 RepID=UPI0033205E1B